MTVASDALLTAMRGRERDQITALLAADPGARTHTGPSGESLVLHACYVGADDLVPLLLGPRALDAAEAAAMGDVAALDTALTHDKESLARRTADGWTPLHLACFFGREGAAALLIDVGAPLDALSTNSTGNTPLHAAIAGASVHGIVKRLVMAGADVTALGERQITPLHIAASRGDEALCELLLSRGAKAHAAMDDGTTPAQLATARGFPGLAEKLIATD